MPKKVKMTVEQRKEKDRDRMRRYREEQKRKDPDGYREKQRIQKQLYRAKNKKSIENKVDVTDEKELVESIKREVKQLKTEGKQNYEVKKFVVKRVERQKIQHEGDETLNELIDKMDLTNLVKMAGPKINRESLMKYGLTIKRVYENMSGEPFNGNLDFLHNVEAVSKYIDDKFSKSGTRLDYYKGINSFLKRLSGYEELASEYAKLMRREKDKYDDQKGKNQLSEAEKKNFVSWDKILKYNTKNLDDEDYLLYTLLTSLPPRRLSYKYLKLVKGKTQEEINKLSKDFNYITVNKKGNPTSIILNVYKTAKRYRQFVVDLTQQNQLPFLNFTRVREAIKRFIRKTKIKSNELIFPNNTGNIYGSFTRRVQEVFRDFKGKNISTNILRHSFIAHYSNKKNISLNTIKLLTRYLGHSVGEFLGYRRFDDAEDLIEKFKHLDNED